MSSESLHAPRERLSRSTITFHQAVVSLIEELEAADWYRQRADDCEDPELKEILLHNMREELEHACMVLEWLRRNVPDVAEQLDAYLYTTDPITHIEAETEGAGAEGGGASGGGAAQRRREEGGGAGGRKSNLGGGDGAAHKFTIGGLKGE